VISVAAATPVVPSCSIVTQKHIDSRLTVNQNGFT
jgi:hypothetical protein